MPFDDSDVKVFSDGTKPFGNLPDDSVADELALLEAEKGNGNVARANRLGALLAEAVIRCDAAFHIDGVPDEVLMQQRYLLRSFAIEVALDAFLPKQLLSQTAQNMFDNAVQISAPSWYHGRPENGAFSFYYLCIRGDRGLVEQRIGEAFASLCGSDKAACAAMGTELYMSTLKEVHTRIEELGFIA